MDFEDEIEVLESELSNLENKMLDVEDSPYHSHLIDDLEFDISEINYRLEELYSLQNEQWERETAQQNYEYEHSVI